MPRGRPRKNPALDDSRVDDIAENVADTAVKLNETLKKREPTPEGFVSRLYHKDCPEGRRFDGPAVDEALDAGWVDTPAKL